MKSNVLILSLLLWLLAGCSSPIKQAGDAHKTAVEKWQALAGYAQSSLINYPVAITAQLSHDNQSKKDFYQLKNIMLRKQENSYNINLIQPVFTHKYICDPICDQLIEYIPLSPYKGTTLLSQYFEHHEYELFEFYGELFKLNESIAELERLEAGRVAEYLDSLIYQNQSSNQLSEFIQYLAERLSVESYQAFLADPTPGRRTPPNLAGLDQYANLQGAGESEHWKRDYGKDGKVMEKDLWLSTDPKDGKTGKPLRRAESRQWTDVAALRSVRIRNASGTSSYVLTPENKPSKAEVASLQQVWQLAKNTSLSLNDYVCSYKENTFGQITALTEKSATVKLIGQARIIKDGIIYSAHDGFLFAANESLSFLPLNGSRNFSLGEIAVCYPQ